MNTEWINFLNTSKSEETEIKTNKPDQHTSQIPNSLTAIANLTIIEVTGKDANQFLQGQLTCNINDLTESNSFFSAFCNAKGRTISTLLIVKNKDSFLLILPSTLMEKVINKLKMYVLRSDVQLSNALNKYCLIGLTSTDATLELKHPTTNLGVLNNTEISIKLPANHNRYLLICQIDHAKKLWTQYTQTHQFLVTTSDQWSYQDISAGLPWLNEESSEEYIPQMLNIDKLGGISFQKGCYTGQEIIARTHYLGKAKRELFLAKCDTNALVEKNTVINLNDSHQSTGKIISLQTNNNHCLMLVVLPTTALQSKHLSLNNIKQNKIVIIDFQ